MLKKLLSKTILFISLLLTLSASAAFAQKATIKGRVVDAATGEPIIGTVIIVDGTNNGTLSDVNGKFVISNITPGGCAITATYLGYRVYGQYFTLAADQEMEVLIELLSQNIDLDEIVVVAQISNESEHAVLSGQKENLVAVQAVSAAEMSRKGISDVQAAVAQVSGISKQEGVKNVFVRGLGDRYNTTLLNGFPLPSEDPEYKNIALDFFSSDVVQSIAVNKVFSASNNGDVGGAVIDISSKELIGQKAFSVSLDGGVNSKAAGADFLRHQDGVNYFGVSHTQHPTPGKYDFANSLDPSMVNMPLNHSYGLTAGRRWMLGQSKTPLALFLIATHSTDYSFTDQIVRNAVANGAIYQDQKGEKSTIDTRQVALLDARYFLNRRHALSYTLLLIHATEEYVGDYLGFAQRYTDGVDYRGFMRRQQSNDNLLLAHQLSTKWDLGERWDLSLGAAYNSIKGLEPDRRENNLSLQDDGSYILTGGYNQRRFFSELKENDVNLKAALRWKLVSSGDIDHSNVTLGYRGRIVDDNFEAIEYSLGVEGFRGEKIELENLHLDDIYNKENFEAGRFRMLDPGENSYHVSKNIHSGYLEAMHQIAPRLAGVVGVQFDYVDMDVDYEVQHLAPGKGKVEKTYLLPSMSLKYDLNDKHSLRLGLSKSYTLPQSKEIVPFQYVNIGFASEGNPNLKPSDNYNADLKWDWYISSSEVVTLGAFYKYVTNPIGRVDQGNSAGLLVYKNIASFANVAGLELEIRKNIFNTTAAQSRMRRLSMGLNASYIFSSLDLDLQDTPKRKSELEGASPYLINGDLSYNLSSGDKIFNFSVVASWFSDRIHTLGTQGYDDIIEKSVVTLGITTSFKMNKLLTVKLKAGNLLDPAYRLERDYHNKGAITLEEFRKGIDFSVGLSLDF